MASLCPGLYDPLTLHLHEPMLLACSVISKSTFEADVDALGCVIAELGNVVLPLLGKAA